ncbi:hypothetical protein BKA69DRAFT_293646 [Paraphysoderma sedebokerense]|nr:hypothetical protein BKA69DRAFT_293646 [Paraphysoderma sedebokerense]
MTSPQVSFFSMFFFFIGGVAPHTKTLSKKRYDCPRCHNYKAVDVKRLDSKFELFFIPLITVKKGEIYYECRKMSQIMLFMRVVLIQV